MSVQRLIAEADKLLEKGKFPEAIAKLKSIIASEPLNQLVATKLASTFAETGDTAQASKILVQLADRLSEAGKSQVAIAVFKQALDYNPNDVDLKVKFAKECEGVGKVGDAQNFAHQALNHFLKRKKYFEAADLMPMLVRVHSKDESMRLKWIEVMQLSQAEKKMIHLLVALCGPPGLMSEEFSVGGEPTQMSDTLYEKLKYLCDWFPKDPRISYAIAWAAFRKQKKLDCYRYLHETVRREPDFCLGLILFARVLAEDKKLNESLFVYQHLKGRLSGDRSTDGAILSQSLQAFVEKNGWITFAEDSDEEMSPQKFLAAITGQEEKKEEQVSQDSEEKKVEESVVSAAPKEIELDSIPLSSTEDGVELMLAGGQVRKINGDAHDSTLPHDQEDDSIVFTSIIKVDELKEKVSATPIKNKIEEVVAPPIEEISRNTEIFSPLEALQAAQIIPQEKSEQPQALPTPPQAASIPMEAEESAVGEATVLFSPVEAIDAGKMSRNANVHAKSASVPNVSVKPMEGPLSSPVTEIAPLPLTTPVLEALPTEDRTTIIERPLPMELNVDLPPAEEVLSVVAAAEIPEPPTEAQPELVSSDPISLAEQGERTMIVQAEIAPVIVAEKEAEEPNLGPAFVKIPENILVAEPVEDVDLGDDLLEGPTKLLVVPQAPATKVEAASTRDEKKDDFAHRLKEAERYLAKRNYYLARKALRHALALGADENLVKTKLTEIRRLELPDGLYANVSSDSAETGSLADNSEILLRLEEDFSLNDPEEDTNPNSFRNTLEQKLDDVFRQNDPKSIMDFGVGLHEMGFHKEAEALYIKIVEAFPDFAYDAYYLAAISKYARKDYAGAVSILKKLSADSARSEQDKVSVYYTLGEVFEKMRQPERSKSFYKKVAEIDSNYRNIRDKLGD